MAKTQATKPETLFLFLGSFFVKVLGLRIVSKKESSKLEWTGEFGFHSVTQFLLPLCVCCFVSYGTVS